jgi:hypothetical protein
MEAGNVILCDNAKRIVGRIYETIMEDRTEFLEELAENLLGHSCIETLTSYMSLAARINIHDHSTSECSEHAKMN